MRTLLVVMTVLCLGAALPGRALGQTPATPQQPPPPPPVWDTQIGASFVGTSGNTDTTTFGGDFQFHHLWPVWKLEANATAVRTTDKGVSTAERYIGAIRAKRTLTDLLSLTTGERAERDRFAGIDFRSILDVGVGYALVRGPQWFLDGLTSIAWKHEAPVNGDSIDDPIGVLQLVSRLLFSPTADTTQRVTFYPDFRNSSAYRAEAEVTAQASINSRLALKIGYLFRYSNEPTPGFVKSDNTTTASLVLRWRSAETMPPK
jgi:putative salt-induced outer membrane protein YdiY